MTTAIRPFNFNRIFSNAEQRYTLGQNFGRRRLENSNSTMPFRRRSRRALGGKGTRGRTRLLTRRKYDRTRSGVLGGTVSDMKYIYKKKRMPYKKRKRWASFIKKVNAVDERELGTRTVLFNDQIINNFTNPTQQGCLTLGLYTFTSTKGWLNDMFTLGQMENEGNPTSAAGATISGNSKVMFHSAVMDVTIRNTSNINAGTLAAPIWNLDANASIELDVYDVIIGENTSDGATTFNDLSSLFNGYPDPTIGGSGIGINIQDRGATPFECPAQLGRFKIKILSKNKYFIPNGQTITFQERNPKRKVIKYGELETNDGWNKRGFTRLKYIIFKLVPGLTVGTNTGEYRPGITVGLTKKYMYKVEGFNEPRERLTGNSYTPGNPT